MPTGAIPLDSKNSTQQQHSCAEIVMLGGLTGPGLSTQG